MIAIGVGLRWMVAAAALVAAVACGGDDAAPQADASDPGAPDADLSGCDREDLIEWFEDADGDSFGNPEESTLACEQPSGFVSNSDDCNDASADALPGGTEVICDGLDNDCETGTDDACVSGCEPFVSPEGSYALCLNATTEPVARAACETMGMTLAQIDTSAENDMLQQEMSSRNGGLQFFIGGRDNVEGQWRWPDGTLFWLGAANGSAPNGVFANWTVGEPNNANGVEDCMEMFSTARWNDVPCSNLRDYACERGP